MVDLRQATANAIEFASASLGPDRATGIRLEEIESGEVSGEAVWLITLSMVRADDAWADLTRKREYKVFTVLKGTGAVTSMKIRELAGV